MQSRTRPDVAGRGDRAGLARLGLVGTVLGEALASLTEQSAPDGPAADGPAADGPAADGPAAGGPSLAGGPVADSSAPDSSVLGSPSPGSPAAVSGHDLLPRVLDCGGGTGTFAVPLARAGAQVTVVDISADALATLSRRAAEVGVADRVLPVPADVDALAEVVPAASFDLVLAHGILDAVDDAGSAFAQIVAAVRPGGLVSLLVGNPVSAVLGRALAGDLTAARRELARLDAGAAGDRGAAGPEWVHRACAEHGLAVEQVHGIGVFADLVPGAALDQPGARAALADLEAACARRSPYADIAARVHVLARRPGARPD